MSNMTASGSENLKQVTIYTDGACQGNPGPGGYGIVLLFGKARKELSGGFRLSTSNRMELYAAIRSLEALKEPCRVDLYSDSEYLVNAMSRGWAKRWKSKGWMRNSKEPALNHDLWERLLALSEEEHKVTFHWVRGHAGDPENERCDELSFAAVARKDLPVDEGYEKRNEIQPHPPKKPEPGGPCPKCSTVLLKKHPKKELNSTREYYYEYYLYCPGCKSTYTDEAARRSMEKRRLF